MPDQKMRQVEHVEIPGEVVSYLQALSYEANGLMVLHTHAMNAGTPKEKLEEIQDLFVEKNTEYRLAAQEAVNEYTKGKKLISWHIDFAEGVLSFVKA